MSLLQDYFDAVIFGLVYDNTLCKLAKPNGLELICGGYLLNCESDEFGIMN